MAGHPNDQNDGLVLGVYVEVAAPPEDVAAVKALLAKVGYRGDVHAGIPLSGGPALPLDWVLTVTLAAPFGAFFTALGAEAGKDAYAAFKEWLSDVREARRPTGERGKVTLRYNKIGLDLPADLPDAAVDALRDIDWDTEASPLLVWEEAHGFRAWDYERNVWRELAKRQGKP